MYSNCQLLVESASPIRDITYDVGHGFFAVDITLHDTILVDTDGRQDIQRILVARIDTVEHQGHDDLLPSGTTLVPELRFFEVHNITNVLHDTVQSTRRQLLILVIVCNGDQQLSVAVIHRRSKIVTIVKGEIVGITGRSSV